MGALFNGKGRRYYILEHKDASKYHQAGESQKIIIDQVELGRDANCQVRFDETFETVSRLHAAIVKDGDGWKLVQLSQTNSTLVNGQRIETERQLENGDEIQLSTQGPRMGFIIPAGKQSLVSSIRMTERLELFRKQALRPYKTAIACIFILFVLACGLGGYIIHEQSGSIKDLVSKVDFQNAFINKQQENYKNDSTAWENKFDSLSHNQKVVTKIVYGDGNDTQLSKALESVKSSVYAVITTVYVQSGGKTSKIAQSVGTGFVTTDGTFVTARHCVEPWFFNDELNQTYAISLLVDEMEVYATVNAYNSEGDCLQMKNSSFRIDNSYDAPINYKFEYEGEEYDLSSKVAFGSEASLGNDWAYCHVGTKGRIKNGSSLSSQLKSGTTVHVLGFPQGNGIADGKNLVDPIYNKLSVARDGLTKARCIMVNQGLDHGNSGGPVFVMDKGQLYVIGIVSRGDHNSNYYNHLIPMCNLN